MALRFHPTNISALLIGRGILASGINASSAITVYSGVQPTAAEIEANWSLYKSTNSNFLGHFTGAVWSQPSSLIASITTFPGAVQASNSGTAAWCIIWTINPALSEMGSSAIPSTSFIVGPVTTLVGTGVVRFNSTTFTANTSISILDGLITTSAL